MAKTIAGMARTALMLTGGSLLATGTVFAFVYLAVCEFTAQVMD